jgi:2',3'-cyclic-nucleotide 2'-phosphodiesterase (5'-nucleotidase family)
MTVLAAERAAATARGAATLTLSSGDFSQGSLASAAWLATSPELVTMKLMGYDAVALGNHEFDLGAKALAGTIQAAGAQLPPLVLSNFLNKADLAPMYGATTCDLGAGPVPCPIAPYRILDTTNGLKIGIVASMGVGAGTVAGQAPANAFWADTATTDETKFYSVAGQIQAAVNAVRAAGVDAVVLLAHGGISGAWPTVSGEDEQLGMLLGSALIGAAQQGQGVDLVLSGHSHLFTPRPEYLIGYGGPVPLVQTKPYGHAVGKVELVFREYGPKVQLDPSKTEFIDVDDRVAKDAAIAAAVGPLTVGFLEYGLDQDPQQILPSFLESTLAKVGLTVPAAHAPGELWNAPLGALDYVVTGMAPGETNALDLDTDAMLAAVRGGALVGLPPAACTSCAATEIAIQASGPIRNDLVPGTTGAIGFADVYHVVPLGGDPTAIPPADMNPATNPAGVQAYLNAVPGYPLVRANLPTPALKAALEGTISTGLFKNGDFFPGVSGIRVEWRLTGSATSPVAVTFMTLADGTVLYDEAVTGPFPEPYEHYLVAPNSFRSVATTFYIAAVALSLGIPMYDEAFQPFTSTTALAAAVVRRGDGSALKDYEALAQFVAAQCAGGGLLPHTWNAVVPRRVVCTGAGCPGGY